MRIAIFVPAMIVSLSRISKQSALLVFLWSMAFCLPLEAQDHVVIDLQGTLVQGIRASQKAGYPPEEIVEAGGRTYRLSEGAL